MKSSAQRKPPIKVTRSAMVSSSVISLGQSLPTTLYVAAASAISTELMRINACEFVQGYH